MQQHFKQQIVKNAPRSRTFVYWFRNDLRLHDNPALVDACDKASQHQATLALVVCLPEEKRTRWGFSRLGPHRRKYLAETVRELSEACARLGQRLIVLCGKATIEIPALMKALQADTLYCEEIAAPEETAEIATLRQKFLVNGFQIHAKWQSSLLEPNCLPFSVHELPLVFTSFKNLVEKSKIIPEKPLAPCTQVPPMPAMPTNLTQLCSFDLTQWAGSVSPEQRSAVPYQDAIAQAGETSALRHLYSYFASDHVRRYKETRNGLIGFDYSTKFSPWLAVGAISARQIYQQLAAHEAEFGANDSTYWIWFELLWRDYFRFLHLRFGRQLYHSHGLKNQQSSLPALTHSNAHFERWCQGNTGQRLIDAGMRELSASGYLSNRMRQIVASFLVNDLQCDWRAGAAWFESQLIDFDIYSNQGNWLYLAGYGTDPRSNRRFNLEKQAQTYDPDHSYVQLWLKT